MAAQKDQVLRVAGVIFAGALAGIGSMVGYQQVNPPRPDPFTGSQGREMGRQIANVRIAVAEMKRDIEGIRGSVERLSAHASADWHPRAAEVVPALQVQVRGLEYRLEQLERAVP